MFVNQLSGVHFERSSSGTKQVQKARVITTAIVYDKVVINHNNWLQTHRELGTVFN